MLPDMIEVGSFIGMVAANDKKARSPLKCWITTFGVIPDKFKQLGIIMQFMEIRIYLYSFAGLVMKYKKPNLRRLIPTIYDLPSRPGSPIW